MSNQKKLLAWLLLLFYLGIPIFLWYGSFHSNENTNLAIILKSLGQVAGITGALFFALNYVLSARFRVVEWLMGGLNRAFITHHMFGAIGFILILFHPLFLGLQYLPLSIQSSAYFFFPPVTEYAQWFGFLSLISLILLLYITFFVDFAYQIWKVTHKFLGVSLLFAFLHILLIPGNLSQVPLLRYYFIVVFAVASFSYCYKTIFGRFFIKRFRYVVSFIEKKGDDTLELFFEPDNKKMYPEPGQFIFVSFPKTRGITREDHPFSITSPQNSTAISIAVKSLGDYTETLKLLQPKSDVLLEGPYGMFLHSLTVGGTYILVGGGIGITPFLSLVRSFHLLSHVTIYLFYAVSTKDEAVYLPELTSIQSKHPSLHVIPFISKEKGRITADAIAKEIGELKNTEVFICGPVPMMLSLRKQFRKLGMKNKKIHTEEFTLN